MLGALFSFSAGITFTVFYNSVSFEFIESTPFLSFLWFIIFTTMTVWELKR